jgi:hypothetical protein|tara:strand:+ start:871 stop:1095 length:225 start_codon:yes stop_codon:yes gene_type:complete
MDESSFDEIISILAKNGRPDLIMLLKEIETIFVDPDYKPTKKVRKEYFSDSEGSALSEDDLDYNVDDEGFHSLT